MASPTPPRRRWFQFGIGRMLVSIAILCAGLALVTQRAEYPAAGIPIVLCGAAVAGSGLFLPFKRPILGAFLGVAMILLIALEENIRDSDDLLYWLRQVRPWWF
ncbi:MAG TPA: hypothetical protein VGJ26_13845 [Pirellulales bacterium]